ncbi:MAG: hypothetical protein ABR903_09585 [Thermodesulfovibrionales bacterium]|jgi:hypothetical protein
MGCKKIIIAIALLMLVACATASKKGSDGNIALDESLLRQSDYIDIVYEDGMFSYVSYLPREGLAEDERKPLCDEVPQQPAPPSTGIWLWDFRRVQGQEQEVVERLSRDHIKKVYIQISGDLEVFRPFLQHAGKRGITVFALDGSPDYIDDFRVLLEDVRKIREFNRAHPDTVFAGLQIDVEPYLKKDFHVRKNDYVRQYLTMAQELRRLTGEDIKLSFALPFWFDKLTIDKKPLSFQITDIADEVVIMSYRTNYQELLDVVSVELCYASSVGKPVYLGLEVNRLPDEDHFIVDKTKVAGSSIPTQGKRMSFTDPYDNLPVLRRYAVRSEKITFFKHKDRLPAFMAGTPPFRSFSGYVIHSYEGLYESR